MIAVVFCLTVVATVAIVAWTWRDADLRAAAAAAARREADMLRLAAETEIEKARVVAHASHDAIAPLAEKLAKLERDHAKLDDYVRTRGIVQGLRR